MTMLAIYGDTELDVSFVAGTRFRATERFAPSAELRLALEAVRKDALTLTGGLLF